jgi:hypothetical protein
MAQRRTEAQQERNDELTLFLRACQGLLLEPQGGDRRDALAVVIGRAALISLPGDSLLVASLLNEAWAHAEELAFRLESPGYPGLYVSALTARLHQTLAELLRQVQAEPGASSLPLAAQEERSALLYASSQSL